MTGLPDSNLSLHPKMRSCFSTMGCPELDLDGVLALAEKHQIDCLEIRSLENRIDLPVYLNSLPGGLAGVREKLRTSQRPVQVLGTSFKLVGDTDAGRQGLIDFANLAEEIDTPYLRIFGGGKWGEPLTDDHYREGMAVLDWWHGQRNARGWKVDLLIETHDAFSASPPLVRLFEFLGRPQGVIWDSHHTWKLGGETPLESWRQLGPYVRHVHIKDSVSEPSARHPYTYVLPGSGQMPGLEVIALLQREGFTGAASLEWEKMWHPYLANLDAALSATRSQGWLTG